jgi:hypothetical protein
MTDATSASSLRRVLLATTAETPAPSGKGKRHLQPSEVVPETCRPGDLKPMFGISRSRAFLLMKTGAIRAVKVSPRLTLVETASVREWLATKPAALGGIDPVRRLPAAAPAPQPTAPTPPAKRTRSAASAS